MAVEILLLPDPVAKAVTYLSQFVPNAAGPFMSVPPNWVWGNLLVVVVDTGGGGERSIVMDDVMLTVEVSHRDSAQASEAARKLHGALRQWPYEDASVKFLRTIQRPTFDPDDVTRTPAYSLTVELSFRAAPSDLTSL